MTTPKYYDIRSDFWRTCFEQALDYNAYLESDPDKGAKWLKMAGQLVPLTESQKNRLRGKGRKLNVLVSSGIWCGDCVRQGPMLKMIADAVRDEIDLRFIERDALPELRDELRILGAMRVPVLVFLTEKFFEIGRFGDRLLTVYHSKEQREMGEACDAGILAPPEDELAAELAEWVDIFERMLIMARLAPSTR